MKFQHLIPATLVKRYKRFLADVVLDNGQCLTVHCPNTGAMTGCAEPGFRVWLSTSKNPKRKYAHTWELLQTRSGDMVCIHSALANTIVREAIEADNIAELAGYDQLRSEVKFGEESSRVDFVLQRDQALCYVEVKCVTLMTEPGLGLFPDAKSERGQKHLRELMTIVNQGHRAVLLFCVQHAGVDRVAPADSIDPEYGLLLREALACGVEVYAYATHINPQHISLANSLQVLDRQPC